MAKGANPNKAGKAHAASGRKGKDRLRSKDVAALDRVVDAAAESAFLGGPTGAVDRADRIEAGRALRARVPFDSHAEWTPPDDRPDPIALLVEQGKDRVAELLPIRYGRMRESPFGFYRGAAAVMAADLAVTPSTGVAVQLCGDGHLVNFGGFGTPERRLIFDVNDFDETLPGPWEWDLKRLAASLAVAARSKDLGDKVTRASAQRAVLAYADQMKAFARMPTMESWYFSIDTTAVQALAESIGDRKLVSRADAAISRAHAYGNLQAVGKLTELVDGKRRIIDQLPLVGHVPGVDHLDELRPLFDGYRATLPDEVGHLLDRFQLTDAARKVVGVGSVGTRCWIALLDGGKGDDPLLLQFKEAGASVLEAHCGASVYANHGQRVVEGQRLMQAASDLFLGWTRDEAAGIDYYWRQLHDMKFSPNVATQPTSVFLIYGQLCGVALARAHARSGDAAAIHGYLGDGEAFARAVGQFAIAYAGQNEQDHCALVDAITSGRLPATADL